MHTHNTDGSRPSLCPAESPGLWRLLLGSMLGLGSLAICLGEVLLLLRITLTRCP
jgi:hypothetical protein